MLSLKKAFHHFKISSHCLWVCVSDEKSRILWTEEKRWQIRSSHCFDYVNEKSEEQRRD
jgi:hypothetical protein